MAVLAEAWTSKVVVSVAVSSTCTRRLTPPAGAAALAGPPLAGRGLALAGRVARRRAEAEVAGQQQLCAGAARGLQLGLAGLGAVRRSSCGCWW